MELEIVLTAIKRTKLSLMSPKEYKYNKGNISSQSLTINIIGLLNIFYIKLNDMEK